MDAWTHWNPLYTQDSRLQYLFVALNHSYQDPGGPEPFQQGLGLSTDLKLDLDAAIRKAQSNLFDIQKPEGYWVGELMVDSTLVSDMVAYHHWDGKIDPEWQRKAVNHILSMQLPDGGWNIYYGGPSEVNATSVTNALTKTPNNRSRASCT